MSSTPATTSEPESIQSEPQLGAVAKRTSEADGTTSTPLTSPSEMPLTPVNSAFGQSMLAQSIIIDDGSKRKFTLKPSRISLFHNSAYLKDIDGLKVASFKTDTPGVAKLIAILGPMLLASINTYLDGKKEQADENQAVGVVNNVNESTTDALTNTSTAKTVTKQIIRFLRAASTPWANIIGSTTLAVAVNYFQNSMSMLDAEGNLHMKAAWKRNRAGYKIKLDGPNAKDVRMFWVLSVDSDSQEWKLSSVDYSDVIEDKAASEGQKAVKEMNEDIIDSASIQADAADRASKDARLNRQMTFDRFQLQLEGLGVAPNGFESGNAEQERAIDDLLDGEETNILTPLETSLARGETLLASGRAESLPMAGPGSEMAPPDDPEDDGDRQVGTIVNVENMRIPLVSTTGDRILDQTKNFMLTVDKSKLSRVSIAGVGFNLALFGADELYTLDFEGDTSAPRDLLAFVSYIVRSSKSMPLSSIILFSLLAGGTHLAYALMKMMFNLLSGNGEKQTLPQALKDALDLDNLKEGFLKPGVNILSTLKSVKNWVSDNSGAQNVPAERTENST
jgi:hypothetical protein